MLGSKIDVNVLMLLDPGVGYLCIIEVPDKFFFPVVHRAQFKCKQLDRAYSCAINHPLQTAQAFINGANIHHSGVIDFHGQLNIILYLENTIYTLLISKFSRRISRANYISLKRQHSLIELDAMRYERNAATKKIKDRLEQAPARPKQIMDDTGLGKSTVTHNLSEKGLLVKLGLIKKLDDGRYAMKGFDLEEERIRDAHNLFKKRFLRSPRPGELAYAIRETPEKTRDLLYKYVPGYSEPSDEEIRAATDDVWNLIFWGIDYSSIEIPDYDLNIHEVTFKSIDCFGFCEIEEYRPVSSERATNYLRECPEMKPEFVCTWNGNKLIIEAVWNEEISGFLKRFPQYGEFSEP